MPVPVSEQVGIAKQDFSLGRFEVLQLMMAVVVACLAVACAQFFGISVAASAPCQATGIYSACCAWQDIKIFLGFGCGAMLCYLLRDEIDCGLATSVAATDGLANISDEPAMTYGADLCQRKEHLMNCMF